MKERIVFVSTNIFRTRRLLPALELLSKDWDITCLSLGNGNIMMNNPSLYHLNLRKAFENYLKSHVFKEVIANQIRHRDDGFPFWYEGDVEKVIKSLDLSKVRCVLYDDSRTAGHQIPKIIFEPWYAQLKDLGIPVIANIHGNVDDYRLEKFVSLECGKIYDELFLYGSYDKKRVQNIPYNHPL